MTKPKNLQSKATEFVLDEMDLAILRALPAHGAKLGKYLPHGIGVKSLPGLVDSMFTSHFYGGKVRSLAYAGYVVAVKGTMRGSSGSLYQRTEKGDAALKPNLRDAADG